MVTDQPPRPETPTWPASEVEQRQVADLVPYARNARTHSASQVQRIAASVREWGWTNPILIDERGTILAGHGRVLAAQLLGLEQVPCVVARDWTEPQKRAYVIADNQLAISAGWDSDMLRLELAELEGADFDLDLLGFEDELLDLLADPSDGEPTEVEEADIVPEPQPITVTRPGDIWALGRHRVMCGDATEAASVQALTRRNRVQLCFTSPPYGQQRAYGEHSDVSDWCALMLGVFANLPLTEAGQVFVNLGLIHKDSEWVPYWDPWIEWMRAQGWRRFGWYVWDQGPGMPGDWNGRLAPSFEFVFHFNRTAVRPAKTRECKHAGEAHAGSGQRGADGVVRARTAGHDAIQAMAIEDSVVRINRQGASHSAGGHPAPFPAALPARFIKSWEGSVYEPFLGSGTTLIAAEQIGRTCYGMEIEPAYVDVSVRRWQEFTGGAATLEETGESFDVVSRVRGQVCTEA